MSIFIEKDKVRYKVIQALPNNEYLITRVDKCARYVLNSVGKISYHFTFVERIRNFIDAQGRY